MQPSAPMDAIHDWERGHSRSLLRRPAVVGVSGQEREPEMIHLRRGLTLDLLCGAGKEDCPYDSSIPLISTCRPQQIQWNEYSKSYVMYDEATARKMMFDDIAKGANCPACLRAYFAGEK